MRLIAETNPERARKFQIAFGVIIHELGIERMPHTVRLKFIHVPPDVREVGFGLVQRNKIGGATNNEIIDGCIEVSINDYTSDCPCKDCREENKMYCPLSTFCHEMVHVKQMINKELRTPPSGIGAWWHNKYYERLPPYKDQPWEHEANQLQEILYRKVLAVMTWR